MFSNLMRKRYRKALREDYESDLQAVQDGLWPRDLHDRMKYSDPSPRFATRMCLAGIAYLDDVERRLQEGDPNIVGWER